MSESKPLNPIVRRFTRGVTAKDADAKVAPVVYETELKERRAMIRSIPTPDAQESSTDSSWAKFDRSLDDL